MGGRVAPCSVHRGCLPSSDLTLLLRGWVGCLLRCVLRVSTQLYWNLGRLVDILELHNGVQKQLFEVTCEHL